MRYPKREVQAMFIRFIKKLCPTSEKQADYFLDYASCYGGYVIEKYRPGESVSFPFGMARKSGKEMYMALSMACDVLDELDNDVTSWMPIADEN